jgi:DNA sulfur modification protein DndD
MILQDLTLRNFCLFRGTQVFHLAPVQRNGKSKPVVLFGGINGGGKTTLFDALQLALYGSRARCSKRLNLAYDEFLVHSIHRGVDPAEGAGVALSFTYARDGQQHVYEVRRDWRVESGKLRETLEVLEDGAANNGLARNWPQVVEELIPLEISQLFFFDGEKIRSLAEDATSSQALGSAVKALLGLDIVERLITDATVLQGRLAKQAAPPEQRATVHALEQEHHALRAALEKAQTERASLENHRLRAVAEQREAEDRFVAAGGKHAEERHDRRARRDATVKAAEELEDQLLALSASELPLALVPKLLD